jgi:hypothetical protein
VGREVEQGDRLVAEARHGDPCGGILLQLIGQPQFPVGRNPDEELSREPWRSGQSAAASVRPAPSRCPLSSRLSPGSR